MEKMAGLKVLPILCASVRQKVLKTDWCVENEFPLDKNGGLGIKKAAQGSCLCQETEQSVADVNRAVLRYHGSGAVVQMDGLPEIALGHHSSCYIFCF